MLFGQFVLQSLLGMFVWVCTCVDMLVPQCGLGHQRATWRSQFCVQRLTQVIRPGGRYLYQVGHPCQPWSKNITHLYVLLNWENYHKGNTVLDEINIRKYCFTLENTTHTYLAVCLKESLCFNEIYHTQCINKYKMRQNRSIGYFCPVYQ